MIVRGNLKKYVGAIDQEEVAAFIYDKYALIMQGFEVRKCSDAIRRVSAW